MRALFPVILLGIQCASADVTPETISSNLRSAVDKFESVEIPQGAVSVPFTVDLGRNPVEFEGESFDGFRFRCPDLREEEDFVWYFNTSSKWDSWYILPVEGEMKPAFKDWMAADQFYMTYDHAADSDRYRVLQTLRGDYFKSGSEYIIWFRKTGSKGDGKLTGTCGFAKRDGSWDPGKVEKALGLRAAPVEDQVTGLKSRGGLILLDPRFFDPDYAKERIESVFFNIRRTKQFADGNFITIKTAIPSCKTSPSMSKIIEAFGQPDLVRTTDELVALGKHTGSNDEPDDEELGIETFFYDYMGFETRIDDPEKKVTRVITQASDFSVLAPKGNESTFATLEMENLTVLRSDGKEVGRIYHFREGAEEPWVVKDPPNGTYGGDNENLIYQGDGRWVWESQFPNGKLARRMPMEGHRFGGKAEGFRENGKPAFTAEYRDGALDGEVVEFGKNGEKTTKTNFKNGRKQ